MSLKKLMNGVAVAALASGALLSGPGAAEARDWQRGHDGGSASVNRWGEASGERHGSGRGAWAHGRGGYEGGGWRGEEHNANRGWGGEGRHRNHTGRNIAIGAFAAVLGLALAAESQRVQDEYYDERD